MLRIKKEKKNTTDRAVKPDLSLGLEIKCKSELEAMSFPLLLHIQ
jgi:hypothetical protein